MSNSLLTPTMVTRKALAILHQKLNFVGSINRQYDDSFAKTGAKIGDTLKVRLPNQYTVRSGANLSTQDTTENYTSIQIATQKGVDVTFGSAELTLSLDDFADRILEPAMAQLAAAIEADALNSMILDVYQVVNNVGSAISANKVLAARKMLVDALAPAGDRNLLLNTQDNVDLVDALKGLFQDSSSVAKQYREGVMGSGLGFAQIMENTLLSNQTTGTAAATTTYLINGASQSGASLVVDTGSTTFLKGDVITIAGVNRCHPESKADTGSLQEFVVTANSGASATALAVSPAIVLSGATQNVVTGPADNAAITKIGTASGVYKPSLAFHKDAFAIAFADLMDVSEFGAWGARQNYDGISMRIARQYAISSDTVPCRLDVMYGYKTIRPQLACRILSN